MNVKDIQPRRAEDVTEAVIKAWKEAHPRGVWQIGINTDEVTGETETADDKGKKKKVTVYVQKKGYFRKPTRSEISASMTLKNDPIGSAEDLLRSCWLGGDEELLEDDDYFQGAVMQFSDLMEIKTGEIKKL